MTNKIEVPAANIVSEKNYCKFCAKEVIKPSRHLEDVHVQKEVLKFLQLKKKTVESRKIQDKIRCEGNFLHNKAVLRQNTGVLKPQLQKNEPSKAIK